MQPPPCRCRHRRRRRPLWRTQPQQAVACSASTSGSRKQRCRNRRSSRRRKSEAGRRGCRPWRPSRRCMPQRRRRLQQSPRNRRRRRNGSGSSRAPGSRTHGTASSGSQTAAAARRSHRRDRRGPAATSTRRRCASGMRRWPNRCCICAVLTTARRRQQCAVTDFLLMSVAFSDAWQACVHCGGSCTCLCLSPLPVSIAAAQWTLPLAAHFISRTERYLVQVVVTFVWQGNFCLVRKQHLALLFLHSHPGGAQPAGSRGGRRAPRYPAVAHSPACASSVSCILCPTSPGPMAAASATSACGLRV